MALESFNSYFSYLEAIEPLNDAERGRLWTALLIYSSTGTVPEMRGNERFLFPSMKGQIDRDREKYDAFCEKQAENGRRGGRPPKPEDNSESQKTQAFFKEPKKAYDKDKDKDKEKAKEKEKEKDKEKKDGPLSIPPTSPSYPPTDGSSCAEAAAPASTPAAEAPPKKRSDGPFSPTVLTLTLNDKSEHIVTQRDVDNWQELFPAVDVMQQLRSMKAWCDANPAQRKTKTGISRFIVSWLVKEQNRGGARSTVSPPARKYQTAAEYHEDQRMQPPGRDDTALARKLLDRQKGGDANA